MPTRAADGLMGHKLQSNYGMASGPLGFVPRNYPIPFENRIPPPWFSNTKNEQIHFESNIIF
jgi:hypothetical protein